MLIRQRKEERERGEAQTNKSYVNSVRT